MRDANRLYGFYDKLREVHMTKFPDLRFGQLVDDLTDTTKQLCVDIIRTEKEVK